MEVKALMTLKDVAKMFQVSTMTVRRWIREKSFPVHKIGSTLRFRSGAVDSWLDEQTKI